VPRAAIISIVDDDESVRAAMSSLIRSLGYEAREFDSAEAFLASPHRHDTACLIADVHMPGMSGLDLQDVLLAGERVLPIIFITAFPARRGGGRCGVLQQTRRQPNDYLLPRRRAWQLRPMNRITSDHGPRLLARIPCSMRGCRYC
jgi:CheY-like chemotaxis protein